MRVDERHGEASSPGRCRKGQNPLGAELSDQHCAIVCTHRDAIGIGDAISEQGWSLRPRRKVEHTADRVTDVRAPGQREEDPALRIESEVVHPFEWLAL